MFAQLPKQSRRVVRVTTSLQPLTSTQLAHQQVVLLSTSQQPLAPATIATLRKWVSRGGGLVVVHTEPRAPAEVPSPTRQPQETWVDGYSFNQLLGPMGEWWGGCKQV